MAGETVVRAEGLGKKYARRLKHAMWYGLRDLAFPPRGPADLRPGEFWALRGAGFELKRGECLGVIGANGSGKSTLLKLLGGILAPDEGRIEVHGRTGALIEIGAGFHPLLTGRENVYVNGAILGMSKREIDAKFDAIVEFAGIGEFLDTPVKFYSSGMYVRLGFAVAAHTQPDVLLVDEVLAVGDAAFKARCLTAFDRLLREGCAVIFISHDLALVHAQCARVLVLGGGKQVCLSDADAALDTYRALLGSQAGGFDSSQDVAHPQLRILGAEARDAQGHVLEAVQTGQPLRLDIRFEAEREFERPLFNLTLLDAAGRQVTAWRTDLSGVHLDRLTPGQGTISVKVDAFNLLPGFYSLSARIWRERVRGELYCARTNLARLQVTGGYSVGGTCFLPHAWSPVSYGEAAS